MKYHTHILIVGAGPAGLTLACFLAKYNVPFMIIDKKSTISNHIKACMLSSRSLEIFSKLGLLDQAMLLGQYTDAFEIYRDKARIVSLDYHSIETPFPFHLHLGQPYTEKVLHEYLVDRKINVLWQHELFNFTQDDNGVTAIISHENKKITIEAEFLVGADGAASKVRQLCQLAFVGDTYPTHFLLGNVKLDWALSHDKARLFFGDFGFLSVYPLPDNMMQIGGNINAPAKQRTPELEELIQLFHKRCFFPGKISDLQWISYHRTHCQHVKNRVLNRAILMGDAAQIISPLTGLGMNAGIQDADNLAMKLLSIYKNSADKNILSSYQDERYFLSKKLSSLSNVLERVYTVKNDEAKRLRDYMLLNLATSDSVRQRETKRFMQI